MAGGIGAKRVDVTWATEESGLLCAISIKSINFRDGKTKNFQKNLTNRRGDMLFEAVTLHRRFPFAVLVGVFFLDEDARNDGTAQRSSTFQNAHKRLALFTGRNGQTGPDEKFEALYIVLVSADPISPRYEAYEAGNMSTPVTFDQILGKMVDDLVTRNPDFYESVEGKIRKV